MSLHPNFVADLYRRFGVTGAEGPEQLQVLRDLLMADPAHSDHKHPGHGPLMADLRSIYAQLHPEQPE